MSGLFGSITIKGNRLTELVGQTSTVGKPIPFGFGKCRIQECNVIWTAGIPKEHVKKKKQGKGGVKTETYTYTLSYAIAVMAGPIHGYLTIKRGGKVVYTTDPTASVDDKAYAAKWLQKVELYYGTRDQMPDPTIESYEGAGNVSAFRDLAYFVVTDDDVTNEGGAVPQYEVICLASPPEIYVTSHVYDVASSEAVAMDLEPTGGELRTILHETFPQEAVLMSVAPTDGELRGTVLTRISSDAAEVQVTPSGGTLKTVIQTTAAQKEAVAMTVSPTGGNLDQVLVTTSPQKEAVAMSIAPTGGTLA